MGKTRFSVEHNGENYEMEFDAEQGTVYAIKKDEFGGIIKYTNQSIRTNIKNLDDAKEIAPQIIDGLGAF